MQPAPVDRGKMFSPDCMNVSPLTVGTRGAVVDEGNKFMVQMFVLTFVSVKQVRFCLLGYYYTASAL